MDRLRRLREARREVQRSAMERYEQRAPERAHNKALIAEAGPGAADSPQRRDAFVNRVEGMKALRNIRTRRDLPFGIERRMGATLDFDEMAPNAAARKAGRSVARIVEQGGPGTEAQGFATGFLVAPDLLITNWHVFQGRGDARGCAAHFLYERSERGVERGVTFELEPSRFFVSDERLDFAILAVAPRSNEGSDLASMGQNTLVEAMPKILKGQPVHIIQHPEGRPKQYAISQNRLVDILEEGFLQYETDTLEGSSGSPAFSDRWELVALHHASIPQMRDGRALALDGTPWFKEMGDDRVHWIANEGVRISAIVSHLRSARLPDRSEQDILEDLLATTGDPVAEAMEIIQPQSLETLGNAIKRGGTMAGMTVTFTGPVTINVNVAGTPAADASTSSTSRTVAFAVERSIRFDPDYDLRKGYSPSFLDEEGEIVVPVPSVQPDRIEEMLKGEDGKPLVLKYHHFELMMNKPRRLQMWSAANVDYDPTRKTDKDREEWGRDRWIPDPRIPAICQVFDADFYKPAGNIDRGHIVRREDNEWGDDEREIEFANSDTFHWTNCTPQHEAFNQSTPGRNDKTYKGMEGVWGAFENHIQQSRRDGDTKACLLAGPILASDDPRKDFGRGEIQYPIRFWKVVCVVDRTAPKPELKAYGFILSQRAVVDRFGIERFGPGRFDKYQVSLSEIAKEAGLVFEDALLQADTLSGQLSVRLASPRDIAGL
ncbi:endonuclease [Bosea caraganae]|uniref:Endonuclease n=2 Tax=Bosea caraganae TaxID=2763117 RepID=A0A370KZ65_9HYPH|nr:endonuclease [Bosea caraganae]RDJ23987.1 endonuclease [Bosea caraganae]